METLDKPIRVRRRTRDAFRGVKLGVRGRSSFFAYFFWALAVVLVGLTYGLDAWEWAALITAFGLVAVTELLFVAITSLCLVLPIDPVVVRRTHRIAAGATLTAILTGLALIAVVIVGRVCAVHH